MFRRKTTAPSAPSDPEPMRTRLPDLLGAQVRIFGNAPSLSVVDAGAHHGHTAVQYLEHFPNSRVIALEPEPENFAIAKKALAPFGERVELLPFALAETDGNVALRLTSHSGAHSLLEVGDMRYYDAPVETLTPIEVRAVTLDSLSAEHRLDRRGHPQDGHSGRRASGVARRCQASGPSCHSADRAGGSLSAAVPQPTYLLGYRRPPQARSATLCRVSTNSDTMRPTTPSCGGPMPCS